MANYNYTPSDQIALQQKMSQELMNTPMREGVKQGVSTDWGRGLAHMLRQYQGGKMRRDATAQSEANTQLTNQDNALMAELLANPDGQAAPDFASMEIAKGLDPSMVQGAQDQAVALPSMSQAQFSTPQGQQSQLAQIGAMQAAKRKALSDELAHKRGLEADEFKITGKGKQDRQTNAAKGYNLSPLQQHFSGNNELVSQNENVKGPSTIFTSKSPLDGYTETLLGSMGERSISANKRINDSDVGLELFKNRMLAGDDTGKWAPIMTDAHAWLGLNSDEVATAQTFDTKMGDKVMSRIQETKGSVSDKEMAFFKTISPGSAKEPLANYMLMEIDRRKATREQDKMNYVEGYLAEKGNLLGFEDYYMKNHDPFPPFTVEGMKTSYNEFLGIESSAPDARAGTATGGLSSENLARLQELEAREGGL